MIRCWLYGFVLLLGLTAGCKDVSDSPADTEKTAARKTAVEETKPAAPPPLPVVAVIETTTKKIRPGFEYPVTIEAVELAHMRPQVAGVIKKQHFSPGEIVKKGDLLVEIDDADYQVKVEEIKALILQAEASMLEARANFERATKLKPDGFISEADYDAAKARDISAKGRVEQLQAQLQRAKLQLGYTQIHAPFSGKISEANFAVGDYVAPSSAQPLFELVKLDPVYVVASLDIKLYEQFVLKRAELKEQGKEIPDLELSLTLASGSTYPHKGVFESWDHTATGSAGTISGRARFPNPDGLLLPGHNLKLSGRTVDIIETVVIPQKAVSQDQQGHYVFVVDADGTVQRRNIEVGIRHGADWSVPGGLESGEKVVVEGLQKVRPGIKVDAQPFATDS